MVNIFELLEQLYKEGKLTYEQYNIIEAVCRHDDEIIEEGVKQLQELEKENAELKAQIEKMQQDQKTAFWKGMRHFANAIKEYDSKNGAATDYLENTVNIVLNHEACKFCKHRKTEILTDDKTGYLCDRRVCTGICFEGKE